jgi:uncharacterized membrane protein YjjB (DUF3815 family)
MSELLFEFLQDAFFSAIAGMGFAMISNPPKRAVFVSACMAAFAHGTRFLLIHFNIDIILATLIVSFCVGLLSIPAAHWVHCPPDVFSFPSLLPMIPGVYAYKSILGLIRFIETDDGSLSQIILTDTVRNGLKATFILMALAIGVSLPMLILGKQSVKTTRLVKIFHK